SPGLLPAVLSRDLAAPVLEDRAGRTLRSPIVRAGAPAASSFERAGFDPLFPARYFAAGPRHLSAQAVPGFAAAFPARGRRLGSGSGYRRPSRPPRGCLQDRAERRQVARGEGVRARSALARIGREPRLGPEPDRRAGGSRLRPTDRVAAARVRLFARLQGL